MNTLGWRNKYRALVPCQPSPQGLLSYNSEICSSYSQPSLLQGLAGTKTSSNRLDAIGDFRVTAFTDFNLFCSFVVAISLLVQEEGFRMSKTDVTRFVNDVKANGQLQND